jgi:hypothetical protein
VVASGFADANVIIKLINEGQIVRFVSKPVDLERLYSAISRAVGMHKLLRGSSVLVERYRVEGAGGAIAPPASTPQTLPSTAQDFEKTQPLRIIEDVPAAFANATGAPASQYPMPMQQVPYSPPSLLSRVRALFGGKR